MGGPATGARPYAAALIRQAADATEVDRIHLVLAPLAEVLSLRPNLGRILQHPGVPAREKRELIALAVKPGESKLVDGLLDLLLAERRIALLPEIARLLKDAALEARGVEAVSVRSAQPLAAAARQSLEKLLSVHLKKKVAAAYHVDPSLIGGVYVETRGEALDASLRGRLEEAERQLLQI